MYVADIYDVGNVDEAYARHMHPGCDRSSGGRGEEDIGLGTGQWGDGMGSTHEVVPTQPPHPNGRVHVRPMRCIRGPSKMESGTDDKTRRNESWWHESAT